MKANSISNPPSLSLALSAHIPAMLASSSVESLTDFNVISAGMYRSALMAMVLSHIKDGIVFCNAEGLILLANAGAKELAQQDPEGKPLNLSEQIWGKLFDVNGSHMAAEEWPLMRALRGESTAYKECHLMRKDGAEDILFSASPIVDLSPRIVGAVATLTNISRHKREEALEHEQSLERERSQMATHIHDTVSQSLTAISLQLQAAQAEVIHNALSSSVYLQRAISVAQDTLADLRRCIWSLSHESLEGEDLAEALSFLARQLFASTPVALELSLQPESSALTRKIRHEILWISKEAFANVLKHSQATKVNIQLRCGEKEIQLRVDDNGQGFGPSPLLRNSKGSFGLISMRKRAQRLGGTLAVDSQPGRGTQVVAVVPSHEH